MDSLYPDYFQTKGQHSKTFTGWDSPRQSPRHSPRHSPRNSPRRYRSNDFKLIPSAIKPRKKLDSNDRKLDELLDIKSIPNENDVPR